MVIFSNCKINIGLQVTAKRNDGYHNLETIFYPLPIYDVLELRQAEQTSLQIVGIPVPCDLTQNIILKAHRLLQNHYPSLPPTAFTLLKNIPIGSGLGAGSANGAFSLLGLNELFRLGITNERLMEYALILGSDCPFFILNKPCIAKGRGETLEPINLNLKGYHVIIVNPGIHISTHWAFNELQLSTTAIEIKNIITHSIKDWKYTITNDFEKVAIAKYPEIENIKKQLYDAGAVFALMTGSGSTVFGIFESAPPIIQFPASYFIRKILL